MTEAQSATERLSSAVPGGQPPTPSGWVFGAVFAAAFAALYLEVALIKLTSLKFHFIFAYAILGVALLGYGAAGSLLAVRGSPTPVQALRRLGYWLVAFSAVVVPAFLAVNFVETPIQQLFGWQGLPFLLGVYALLTLPFLLIGFAVCIAFSTFAHEANRVYFADLLGAGAGAALAILTLPWLGGVALVAAAGLVAGVGAFLAARAARSGSGAGLLVASLNLVLVVLFATLRPIEVTVAPDKHGPILSRMAKPGGLSMTFSRWSPFGRVDVSEPFDTLPPLFGGDISPTFRGLRIEQRMLLLDGAAPGFLYRVDGSPREMAFLAGTSQSIAYRLRPRPRVLTIGVGGATDVLIALHHEATRVVAVEVNPVTITAARDVYGDYLGNVLKDPRVRVVVAEGRHFVARDREQYDIVQLSGVDTGAALGAAGLGTMPESYIYTLEAMRDFLHRLAPGGVLSITRDLRWGWALRLASTARAALIEEGLDPAPRIAVLEGKGWGWATLLVKREPFSGPEVAALEEFAASYQFPLLYNPDAPVGSAFDRAIRDGATAEGTTDLRPATDDWPFFFLSFRWDQLLRRFPTERSSLINPIGFLLASLVGLTLMAVALIGWPLWQLRAGWRATSGKAALVGYFAALGAGFMLVEVALIQRFTVFLGDPTLAVATVLGALLVSSGVGSYAARTWRADGRNVVPFAVAWIVVALFFFASPLLRGLLWKLLAMPDAIRIGISVVLIGAVGVAMGMPFPAGLTRIANRAAPFVPWAWGINALLSVVASLSSYLLGMILGYTPMFYIGAALYATALLLSRRL